MDGDAPVSKRDFGLDTRSMEEFARSLFGREWTETIVNDLGRMNAGKKGRPFVFTDGMVRWANRLRHALGMSYRLARGCLNLFLEEEGLPGISLAQFYDRCRRASAAGGTGGVVLASGICESETPGEEVSLAVDSTGMSLNKYGGWLSYHWNKQPVSGWIKVHAAVDPDTDRILAYAVTDERCADVTMMDRLVEMAASGGYTIRRILADAAYDKKGHWTKYSGMGIDVVINPKSSQLGRDRPTGNCGIRSHGCVTRGIEMKRILEVGRDQWKLERGYSRRWKAECTFSDLKRLFGDVLRARKQDTDAEEAVMKVALLNEYKTIRTRCGSQ